MFLTILTASVILANVGIFGSVAWLAYSQYKAELEAKRQAALEERARIEWSRVDAEAKSEVKAYKQYNQQWLRANGFTK